MQETVLDAGCPNKADISNSDTIQEEADQSGRAKAVLEQYLLEKSPEYRRVAELREKGWRNPEGDRYFQQQRQKADHADDNGVGFFYNMMKEIGREMQRSTGAFTILETGFWQPSVLDLCMAPGGFVATALDVNPSASATGFSLPPADGGHKIHLPPELGVTIDFLDVTMLAADMGVADIPPEHPEALNFVRNRRPALAQMFDLVLCDGQVLRTHNRASHREKLEPSRLTASQLALGLGHVRPGGSMIVLLHKVDAWDNVCLLYGFSKFADVKVFKPRRWHAKRGSFYMIATNIKSRSREAIHAVDRWKREWEVATFGTEQEYRDVVKREELDVEEVLEEFGPKLISLGKLIWNIQATGLMKAPFVRGG